MPGPWASTIVSTTVAGSPATNEEKVVAQIVTVSTDTPSRGVDLSGWAAFTVGTSGTAVRMRIRQSSVTGTIVADTGALTAGVAAAALVAQDVEGFDRPGDVAAFTYVLTLQVTGGAAASTVSAVKLRAILAG